MTSEEADDDNRASIKRGYQWHGDRPSDADADDDDADDDDDVRGLMCGTGDTRDHAHY